MKSLLPALAAVALSTAACSSSEDPSPKPVKIRPTVELVAVTVTGLAPLSQRPDLSLNITSQDGATFYTGTEIRRSATLPARFWIPGSYKGNRVFRVVLLNKGQALASVDVDPEQYKGEHRFNVGSGATDVTIELAF